MADGSPKVPFAQRVASELIEQLEQGTAPWQRPWDPSVSTLTMPVNPVSRCRYRGINAVYLMATAPTEVPPPRSSELLSALVKAAHSAVWAEDSLLWHEDSPDAPAKSAERDQCLTRCERVVLRARAEGILAGSGVRALLGILFETITIARWQIDAQRPDLSLTRNELTDDLRRRLVRTWHANAQVRKVQRLLRIAS